jgi:hypothetical protein
MLNRGTIWRTKNPLSAFSLSRPATIQNWFRTWKCLGRTFIHPSIVRPLKQNTKTWTYSHASNGIRTHDPNVPVAKDSMHHRPRDHCKRQERKTSNILMRDLRRSILPPWRLQGPLERCCPTTTLHGVTTLKTSTWRATLLISIDNQNEEYFQKSQFL